MRLSPRVCDGAAVRRVVVVGVVLIAASATVRSSGRAQAGAYGTTNDLTTIVAVLDSTVRAELRRYDVHGGVLAVVHGGRVIASRGYGVADTAGTAVDPNVTTFGVSSMSKVFTTIAVLQLVDRGLIRLDDPVSRHVPDVPLDARFPRVVTIVDLLTHSGGFDDANIGIAARTPDAIVPLGEFLRRAMPRRVRPAGDVTSYSNHGFALAGLVVERVAKRSFSDYVRANIFDSLGVMRSGFEQPLAANVERSRALPLRRAGDGWAVVPRIYFNDAPASAVFTTAADMSRFMIDFLDTRGTRRRLLSDSLVARMQQPQFTNHPAVLGLTFGFRERRDAQVQSIEQGGDWQDYSSDLLLAPDLGLGLFLALSNDAADRIAPVLWRQLLQSLEASGGAEAGPTSTHSASVDELARVSGTYRVNRYSRHSPARLGVLTGAIRHERIERDGTQLRRAGAVLHSISPGVFMLDGTRSRIAFRLPEGGGKATHLFFENSPYAAYERVRWFEDSRLHLAAFSLCIAAFVATLVGIVADAHRRVRGDGARTCIVASWH